MLFIYYIILYMKRIPNSITNRLERKRPTNEWERDKFRISFSQMIVSVGILGMNGWMNMRYGFM